MSQLFNLNLNNTSVHKSAKEIIEEQCEFLAEQTQNWIAGKVQDYSGSIENHTRPGNRSPMKALTLLWQDEDDEEVDIQTQLGELSNSVFTYDFYITSRNTPNYKYRVMFFRYGIGLYPTKIVLDEDISKQLGSDAENPCKTQDEFEQRLTQIMNSAKFQEVIQNLYTHNKKIEDEILF